MDGRTARRRKKGRGGSKWEIIWKGKIERKGRII
jgi:hypothetical protein